MILFRAMSFGKPIGPWRQLRAHAEEDLINEGEASRDENWRPLFLSLGAAIARTEAPGVEEPAWARDERLVRLAQVERPDGVAPSSHARGRALVHWTGRTSLLTHAEQNCNNHQP